MSQLFFLRKSFDSFPVVVLAPLVLDAFLTTLRQQVDKRDQELALEATIDKRRGNTNKRPMPKPQSRYDFDEIGFHFFFDIWSLGRDKLASYKDGTNFILCLIFF